MGQGVHPGRPGRDDTGRFDRRTPALAVESRPLDRTPLSGGEDQRYRHPLVAERVLPWQRDRKLGVLLSVFRERLRHEPGSGMQRSRSFLGRPKTSRERTTLTYGPPLPAGGGLPGIHAPHPHHGLAGPC